MEIKVSYPITIEFGTPNIKSCSFDKEAHFKELEKALNTKKVLIDEGKLYSIQDLRDLEVKFGREREDNLFSKHFIDWLEDNEDTENPDTEAVNPYRPVNKIKVKIKKSK